MAAFLREGHRHHLPLIRSLLLRKTNQPEDPNHGRGIGGHQNPGHQTHPLFVQPNIGYQENVFPLAVQHTQYRNHGKVACLLH